MTGKTLIVGAAIVIGAVVLNAGRGGSRTVATEPRAATATADDERSSHATAHVWRPSTTNHASVSLAAAADAATEPPPPTGRAPVRPKRNETLIEQFAPVHDVLEAAFVLESHDGAWSMDAQRTAEAVLSAILSPRAAVKSIDCRSTLCRIETTHDGYPDAKLFVSRLVAPAQRPWNGAFYTGPLERDSGTGIVTFVTYLAREGAAMPTIPDPPGEEQAM